MFEYFKSIFIIFISFSSGLVISSAVFAFISAIGVVPELAGKTKTTQYITLYEEMIIFGGIFGSCYSFMNYDFQIGYFILGKILVVLFFLGLGIFFGVLASSLAEVIDVIPIFSQRTNIKNGIPLLLISLAIGKAIGSLIYFLNISFQSK